MKTPTLIVRLLGLYLLVTCSVGLIELHQARALTANIPFDQTPVFGHANIYLCLGWVLGLALTAYAGPLARILTFDSDPAPRPRSLIERLLDRPPIPPEENK